MSEKARVYARFHKGGRTLKNSGGAEHEGAERHEKEHGRGGIVGAVKHWIHHQFHVAPLPLSFTGASECVLPDRVTFCN